MGTLSTKQKIQELKEIVENIELFVSKILKDGKSPLVKPLSVELRKLYSTGKGNNLLKRLENDLKVELVFPNGSHTLPRTKIYVGIDEYINRMIFAIKGRTVTRIQLLKLVANQKGAHLDRDEDVLHKQSQEVALPLGNLARGGVLLEQNTRYLVEIAQTTTDVINKQILSKL